MDVFYYDFKGGSTVLRRITNTPYYNETQPMPYDSANIAYLSDESGVVNRYLAHLDSALAYVDTVEHYRMVVESFPESNYSRNILQHDVNSSQTRVSQIFFDNGKIKMFNRRKPDHLSSTLPLPKTLYRNEEFSNREIIEEKEKAKVKTEGAVDSVQSSLSDSNFVDIDNYVFQSDFPKSKSRKEKKREKEKALFTESSQTEQKGDGVDSVLQPLPKIRNASPRYKNIGLSMAIDA